MCVYDYSYSHGFAYILDVILALLALLGNTQIVYLFWKAATSFVIMKPVLIATSQLNVYFAALYLPESLFTHDILLGAFNLFSTYF